MSYKDEVMHAMYPLSYITKVLQFESHTHFPHPKMWPTQTYDIKQDLTFTFVNAKPDFKNYNYV